MVKPASNDKATKASRSGRKYLLLGGLVLAVILGWSVFWFVSYNKTQTLLDQLMAHRINGEPVLHCDNQKLGGYPFRLLLTCSNYQIINADSGWQVTGGPLRVIWQVYAPDLALLESELEVSAKHHPTGQSFDIQSDLLRASVRFTPAAQISRASIEMDKPTITSTDPLFSGMIGILKAQMLALHARANPVSDTDLDLAINATELELAGLPVISGDFSFTAIDGLAAIQQNHKDPTRAWMQQSGRIEQISSSFEIGQKTLKLSGDITLDDLGQANGALALKILNPRPEDTKIGKKLTARNDGLNGPLTALQLMGKPVSEDNLVGSEVPISISNGKIKAGILPLGKIPAIR